MILTSATGDVLLEPVFLAKVVLYLLSYQKALDLGETSCVEHQLDSPV
jgi:hypothetical protein